MALFRAMIEKIDLNSLYAIFRDDHSLIDEYIAQGGDLDREMWFINPYMDNGPPIDYEDESHCYTGTLLMLALSEENHELALALLDRGANPSLINKEDQSPLDVFAQHPELYEYSSLAHKLIDGADNKRIHSALYDSTQKPGQFMRMLLEAGADPNNYMLYEDGILMTFLDDTFCSPSQTEYIGLLFDYGLEFTKGINELNRFSINRFSINYEKEDLEAVSRFIYGYIAERSVYAMLQLNRKTFASITEMAAWLVQGSYWLGGASYKAFDEAL